MRLRKKHRHRQHYPSSRGVNISWPINPVRRKFTWCNNRSTCMIQEKLDRCISNWEWRMFPHASVTALVPITSDHSPLIIEDSLTGQYSKKNFKLEPYWTEHDEVNSVIEQGWKHNKDNILNNIASVKAKLENRSKQTFRRADHKIKKLKRRLEVLHKRPSTKETMEERYKLKKEVKSLWEQEEMYVDPIA